LEKNRSLRLVFKDLSPSAVLATASQVRPRFLYHPLREIETYRNLLNRLDLGTARCYGDVIKPEAGRYWLFLERVDGPLLWQLGGMRAWCAAARWLGRLHTRYQERWKTADALPGEGLLQYDKHSFQQWMERAEEFLRRRRLSAEPRELRRFGRLASKYDRHVRKLAQQPRTLVHGEFYPSNLVMPQIAGKRRVCPIDWELCGLGPSALDLAALTSGEWSAEHRKQMIFAYRESMLVHDATPPSISEMLEAVADCQLHLCVQLLGWAAEWDPPELHARNWLREALRLAAELGY
jgi:thiamine kinase-like enzyme